MPEYALILLVFLAVATYLHYRFKLKIYKSRRHFIIFNLAFLVLGIIWDNFAIARGHWTYADKFILGPRIGFMPIEDIGFGLILVYFGLVLYKLIGKYYS